MNDFTVFAGCIEVFSGSERDARMVFNEWKGYVTNPSSYAYHDVITLCNGMQYVDEYKLF